MNEGIENKKCVLVVDDEMAILRFIGISLKASGYKVICANSGQEALTMVEQEKPDIVVLDVFMPGMNGFEVLEKIRQTTVKVPVLVSSARASIAERAMSLGANGFIAKPFTPDYLIKKIQALLPRENSASNSLRG